MKNRREGKGDKVAKCTVVESERVVKKVKVCLE